MTTYTLTSGSGVIRSDGAYIPESAGNGDWEAYQAWLTNGGVPNPAPNTAPVAGCSLWQLQAILPANTWNTVQTYIANSGNNILIAFSTHGSALIPSNSTTLATLAVVAGIDPNSLYDLVSNAANISIP